MSVSHVGLESSMSELFAFGACVRRCRRALDLTREELAAQIGCAAVTIRHIETDERRPSTQLAAPAAGVARRIGGAIAPSERDTPPLPQPIGTVTFLFTDIDRSTRLWA